jgi:hypothetical protein
VDPTDSGGSDDDTSEPLDSGGSDDSGDPGDSGGDNDVTIQPTCTQKGQACDPALADQGSFWCANDGGGGGGGECLPKCTEILSANGCGSAEYCWNIGSESEPAPACIASDCQTDGECGTGTCLNFDNQFGVCLTDGPKAEGQACGSDAADRCGTGLFCRTETDSVGNDQRICRTLCNLWSTPSCPNGQACSLFSSEEGICVPDVDGFGTPPYGSCSTAGDMCGHTTPCLGGFSDGLNYCRPFCRPGMGDCPLYNGTTQVVCNNYVVPGQRSWGLCLGTACGSNADCGTGGQCETSTGICRRTCPSGNAVQDCCSGDTDCDWSCVNGLCE